MYDDAEVLCDSEVGDKVGVAIDDTGLDGGDVGAAVLAEAVLVPIPLDLARLESLLQRREVGIGTIVFLSVILKLYADTGIADALAIGQAHLVGIELKAVELACLQQFVVEQLLHLNKVPLAAIC